MTDRSSDPDAPTPVDHPRIVVTGKGPYLCYGVNVEVDGYVHVSDVSKPFALCACGLSQDKPWCDGSHKLVNDITQEEKIEEPK